MNKYEYVKNIKVEDYLNSIGAKFARNGSKNSVWYFCPFHAEGEKANLVLTRSKNVTNCFACEFGGDVINMASFMTYGRGAKRLEKEQFNGIIQDLYSKFGGSPEVVYNKKDYASYEAEAAETQRKIFDACLSEYNSKLLTGMDNDAIRYASVRGISLDTCREYGITGCFHQGTKYLVIPLIHKGEIKALKYRRNDLLSDEGVRYYMPPTSKTSFPFVCKTSWDSPKDVLFFVEDSFSALAIRDLGFSAISLYTSNILSKDYIDMYKELTEGRKIVCLPDNDVAGKELVEQLKNVGILRKKI